MSERLPIREISAGLRDGTIDRASWYGTLVQRYREREPDVRAFLYHDPAAFEPAPVPGPLAGIPVAVKDNILVRGMPATCGSRILESFTPTTDATAIARLIAAGARIAGKTNMDEFAMGSSTEHSAFGPTVNPLDAARVAGGSSGGSAAAVASGMVPVALGSDTGGSVRQPAAFCGVVGFKPTWGAISRSGLVAFASSLDQIGILARSVEDCALVFEAVNGDDPLDATSLPGKMLLAPPATLEGARLGVVRELREGLAADVARAFDEALQRLREAGARIVEISLPTSALAVAIYHVISSAEASSNLSRFDGVRYGLRDRGDGSLASMYRTTRSRGFGDEVRRRILLGAWVLSAGHRDAYYGRAQRLRAALSAEAGGAFEACDAILTPTTATGAFRRGERLSDPVSMYLSDSLTAIANLAGLPAIAIPHGKDGNGMPLSIQLMGARASDPALLALAQTVEGRVKGEE